jgi:hypothetical protein
VRCMSFVMSLVGIWSAAASNRGRGRAQQTSSRGVEEPRDSEEQVSYYFTLGTRYSREFSAGTPYSLFGVPFNPKRQITMNKRSLLVSGYCKTLFNLVCFLV